MDVLRGPNPRGPLTREALEQTLFPNRNLQKRIWGMKGMLHVADLAASAAVKRSADQMAGSEPPASAQ